LDTKKIEVLENTEDGEIEGHQQGEEQLAFPGIRRAVDMTGDCEVYNRRSREQKKKSIVPMSVENVTGDEEDCILGSMIPACKQIGGIHEWEEAKE